MAVPYDSVGKTSNQTSPFEPASDGMTLLWYKPDAMIINATGNRGRSPIKFRLILKYRPTDAEQIGKDAIRHRGVTGVDLMPQGSRIRLGLLPWFGGSGESRQLGLRLDSRCFEEILNRTRTVGVLPCPDRGEFGHYVLALVIINGAQTREQFFGAGFRVETELCFNPPVSRFQWIIQIGKNQ